MSELPPLRLAFLGGRGHAYLHPALKDADLTIEALAAAGDGHDDQAARQRWGQGGMTWFDTPDAMLDTFKPNIVNVGAVYAHNGQWVEACLQRGIAVVSDKPIAAETQTLDRIESLLKQDDAAGLAVEFDFRSRPTFRAARDAVQDGQLGQVVLATAQKSYRWGQRPAFYKRREDYSSTMLWIASHAFDAIVFTTGQRISHVSAVHGNLTQPDYPGCEDHAAAMLTLSDQSHGLVHADLLRPPTAPTHGDDRLRLIGSLGQLEIQGDTCRLTTHQTPETELMPHTTPRPLHRELLAAALLRDASVYPVDELLHVSRALLAARNAADSGTPQAVPNASV